MGKIEKAKGGGRWKWRWRWRWRKVWDEKVAEEGWGRRGQAGKRKYGCHAKARAVERTEVRKAAEKKRDGGL